MQVACTEDPLKPRPSIAGRQTASIPLDRVSRSILRTCAVVGKTWRYRLDGPGRHTLCSTRPCIVCFWHEYLLYGFHYCRTLKPYALVSTSKDGSRLSAVLERWDYRLVRGSSTRKSYSSLRACIRALKEPELLALTPDGPRGPRRQAKPGAAHISLATSTPIVPLSITATPSFRLKSWDRFALAAPLASIRLYAHEPILAEHARDAADPVATLTDILQRKLGA